MRVLSIDVGTKNLALCLIDSEKVIHEWDVDGVPSEHKDHIFLLLKKHLDARPWTLTADTVLIEKQPDKNKRMKSVENFLHTYFLVHELNTILYDARHKVPDVVGPGKRRYNQRKMVSIERCIDFLKETNQRIEFFKKHSKKDDLADTVMQALSYFDRIEVPKEVPKKTIRKPTQNQKETKYSRANLAWLVKNQMHENDKRFTKDLKRYYRTFDELVEDFGI